MVMYYRMCTNEIGLRFSTAGTPKIMAGIILFSVGVADNSSSPISNLTTPQLKAGMTKWTKIIPKIYHSEMPFLSSLFSVLIIQFATTRRKRPVKFSKPDVPKFSFIPRVYLHIYILAQHTYPRMEMISSFFIKNRAT